MDRARASRERVKSGLRWSAAGGLVAALGATAWFKRKHAAAAADPAAEFAAGRGAPSGGVDRASREAGYEVVDTDVRSLIKVMVVAIGLGIVSLTLVFWMFARFNAHYRGASAGLTSQQSAAIVPPLPHLQADPYRDIDTTVMEQRKRIDTYGWDDPSHRQAHIPVARAMRQVVGTSLDADVRSEPLKSPAPALAPATSPVDRAEPQDKPANHMQGEGRPGMVAPSYDPRAESKR